MIEIDKMEVSALMLLRRKCIKTLHNEVLTEKNPHIRDLAPKL